MANNTITGTVAATKHAGTSYYGNPAYWITIVTEAGDTVTLRTSADVMFAYGCENSEYRDNAHVFHLTRAGRIRSAKEA